MNRVLFEIGELERPLPLHDHRARHILKVLGAVPGDQVRVGIVDGPCGTAVLRQVSHAELVLESEQLTEVPAALYPVTVVLGHTRPIVLQRVLRDLSTLGVAHIVVTHTELGEKSYFKSSLWQADAYRSFLLEGAAQAGSTRLPQLDTARHLGEACHMLPALETHRRYMFDLPAGGHTQPPAAVPSMPGGAGFVAAFGSERGWTERERRRLESEQFLPYSLGSRILRSETAALGGTMLLLQAHGFFA